LRNQGQIMPVSGAAWGHCPAAQPKSHQRTLARQAQRPPGGIV